MHSNKDFGITMLIITFLNLVLIQPVRSADEAVEIKGRSLPGIDRANNQLPAPPLSFASASAWLRLHESVVTPLPDQASFVAVLQAIKTAICGTTNKNKVPLNIYVTEAALKARNITEETKVNNLFIGKCEISAYQYLYYFTRQFHMIYKINNGVVVIELPCDDCDGPQTFTTQEAWTWIMLRGSVTLRYPEETSLLVVLQAIQHATVGKGKDGRGMLVHVDMVGLNEVGATLASTVKVDLENVEICTLLGIVLKQLDLGFQVKSDGIVNITSKDNFLSDESEVLEELRKLHYDLNYFIQNQRKGE